MARDFDTFISYNSTDKADALAINAVLKKTGLITWFDEDQAAPGRSVIKSLDDALSKSLSCVVLIGNNGPGQYQDTEIDIALHKQIVSPNFRVIPVILASVTGEPKMSGFLRRNSFIDLRPGQIAGIAKLLNALQPQNSYPLYQVKESISTAQAEGTDDDLRLPVGYSADVSKVVELLIGESLYSRREVSVRELIQNAVDACYRRRVKSNDPYSQQVVLTINTQENSFQVSDNGEGMNVALLARSFAVIGKSIREEDQVLAADKAKLANVISKFGIGFVSTFMISSKVYISTTFIDSPQINLTIIGFDKRFSYTDLSMCDRNPNDIGTTIKVYLNAKGKNVDIAAAARRYIRHIPWLKLITDEVKQDLKESWNTENSVFSKRFRGNGGTYELELGATTTPGRFSASNAGFLITDSTEAIVPFFTPSWIVGEVNLQPGIVELNVARDAFVINERLRVLKGRLHTHFSSFFSEICGELLETLDLGRHQGVTRDSGSRMSAANLMDLVAFRPKEQPPKTQVSSLHQVVTDALIACVSLKNSNLRSSWSPDALLVDPEHAKELLLDLWHFNDLSGRKSLRQVIENLKRKGLKIAFRLDQQQVMLPFMQKELERHGYLVAQQRFIRVSFRGSTRGAFEVWDYEVLASILASYEIMLAPLSEARPEQLPVFLSTLGSNVPDAVRSSISEAEALGCEIRFIQVEADELVHRWGNRIYLNVKSRVFEGFLQWARTSNRAEVRMYILGLTQSRLKDFPVR